MRKITVVKRFEFCGAHRLPNYKGACNNLHGHNWIMEVGVSGPVDQDSGMIIDFKLLKKLVTEWVIDLIDHRYFNEINIAGFPSNCPTAENLIIWIARQIQAALVYDETLEVSMIRLWEASGSYVEWRP